MRKTIEEFYCDECKKQIASREKTATFENYDLLALGVFIRPMRSEFDLPKDDGHLCQDCMLKLLDKWREEVRGH